MGLNEKIDLRDYLEKRGIELHEAGSGKYKCCCPFPDHEDTRPSFSVGEFSSGGYWFNCFGCGKKGDGVKLIAMLEERSEKEVCRELASKHGLSPDDRQKMNVPRTFLMSRGDQLSREISVEGRLLFRRARAMRRKSDLEVELSLLNRVYSYVDDALREGKGDELLYILSCLRAGRRTKNSPPVPPRVPRQGKKVEDCAWECACVDGEYGEAAQKEYEDDGLDSMLGDEPVSVRTFMFEADIVAKFGDVRSRERDLFFRENFNEGSADNPWSKT